MSIFKAYDIRGTYPDQIDADTARDTINILLKYQSDITKALRELEDTKSEMHADATTPA